MTVTTTSSLLGTGTITSSGVGSGLDVTGLVSKLMTVEQIPITQLQTKESSIQAKISAYGTLQSALSTLQSSLTTLADASNFNTQSVSVANSSAATATATSSAVTGSSSLSITQLAQSQTLVSSTDWTSSQTTVGTGTLTFDFGTYSGGSFTENSSKGTKTVTIDSSNDTLTGIASAINAANIGVTANLINDGSGERLTLTSTDTGAANALRISTSDSGLSALTYDASTGGTSSMTQTLAAQDAQLTVNGVAITRSSNTVSDAITGVTLQLAATTSSATTVTVSRSTSSLETNVQSFVTAYNAMEATLSTLTAYNTTTQTGGLLLGDATTLSIETQIKRIINTPISSSSSSGLTYLSNIGVVFQQDGTLSLNTSKLSSVLSDSTKDISTLFAAVGKTSDALVSYTGTTSSTQTGSYAVNITQNATHGSLTGTAALSGQTTISSSNNTLALSLDGVSTTITLSSGTYSDAALLAQIQGEINGNSTLTTAGVGITASMNGTQGKVVGSAATSNLTLTSSNNSFNIAVDGGTAVQVTVPTGTYTAASLASQLQTSINAQLSSAGTSVTVSQSNGVLSIASNSYGSSSSVALTDSVSGTVANLFGSSPTTTAGTGTSTITLTSDSYGSASVVDITGGTAASALFGASTLTGTNGVDVAGTIGATTAATQGTSTGSTALSSSSYTVSSSDNDLSITLNGTTASITLDTGTYTPAQLATEIQSKINANSTLSSAGASVSVSLNSSNQLVVTSNAFGASSSVTLSGGVVTDFFGTATSVAGIAAVGGTATGYGQQLTAASGNATGLKIVVNGGSTGSRGTVSYTQGVAYSLNQTITSMLNTTTGVIATSEAGLNKTITNIEKQISTLTSRNADTEARYLQEFNSLDTLLASMEETASYLAVQLSSSKSS